VIWGGLHGLYLSINHAWRKVRFIVFGDKDVGGFERLAGTLLTFLAVVVGWVFFRASNATSGLSILKAMSGANGITIPNNWLGARHISAGLDRLGITAQLGMPVSHFDQAGTSPYWIVVLLAIAWLMPNSQQFMAGFAPALEEARSLANRPKWSTGVGWAITTGILAAAALLHLSHVSEFLYFQF
jgi:hypothetical protein